MATDKLLSELPEATSFDAADEFAMTHFNSASQKTELHRIKASRFKGETGDTGPQGPQGPQGATGPQGPQGTPTEVNGKSGASITLTGSDIAVSETDARTIPKALKDSADALNLPLTASGSFVTFTSAAAGNPVNPLIVNIEAVQSGSGDPSPDNVRPITGWTGATVKRTGRNLVSIAPFSATWATRSGDIKNAVNALPPGQYTFSALFTLTNADAGTGRYSGMLLQGIANQKMDAWPAGSQTGDTHRYFQTFTITENTQGGCIEAYVYGYGTISEGMFGSAQISELQIETGTFTEYEAYRGQSVTISFGSAGTVYGGTLDVARGMLTVTDANIASYAGETLPGEWISDRDVYSAGGTPSTGAQVVYQLAEPVTYQLTPQEVNTLLGVNNLWTDCGDVDVAYRAGENPAVLTVKDIGVAGGAASYTDYAALEARVKALEQALANS